jgi:hypothetical protein
MVDLRTLLLLVAAADVAVAVVLAVGAGRRLRFGIAPWIGSLFMRCLAISVLVARLEPQAAVSWSPRAPRAVHLRRRARSPPTAALSDGRIRP